MGASVRPGSKVRVFLQTEDGEIMDMSAYAVEVERTMDFTQVGSLWDDNLTPILGSSSVELTLKSVGPVTFQSSGKFAKSIAARRSSSEYRCDYCGMINRLSSRKCEACGAPRSFLLD